MSVDTFLLLYSTVYWKGIHASKSGPVSPRYSLLLTVIYYSSTQSRGHTGVLWDLSRTVDQQLLDGKL